MSQDRRAHRHAPGLVRKASSIRLRIVLLAIVAMAPLLADRVRFMETARSERIAAAGQDAVALARAGVDRQNEVVGSARALLQTVGHATDRMPPGTPECNRFLSDTASDVAWLKFLIVATPDGTVLCSSNPQRVGSRIAGRSYFHDAATRGGYTASDPLYVQPGAEPEIMAAYGRPDPAGAVRSVIVASVDTKQIGNLPSLLRRESDTVTLVVDSGGTVTSGYPEDSRWSGRDIAHTSLQRAVSEQKVGAVVARLDGVSRIWGFAPLPDAKGHLLVGIDERATLLKVDHEMTTAYLQLGLAVLLMLLGAWFFGEHTILAPIRTLARHAERIGRGDLSVRAAGSQWTAEFGSLARTLDSMAERLATRENDLRAENNHFKELATVDSLTQLNNRRAFDARINAAWARASAANIPLGLLMIDVDLFKRFNDRYGHLEGDACLRAIAGVLANLSVEAGWSARYGGEEFAILLFGVAGADAGKLAEEVRRAVVRLDIPHADAPTGVVTVSVGAASLVPRRNLGVDDLIEAADAALYASKQRRNAVTAYEPRLFKQAG